MRKTLLTAVLMIGITAPAHSAYFESYSDWRATSEAQKGGFVMGVYDARFSIISENAGYPDPYREANSVGARDCFLKLRLNSVMLVQLVETYYAQNPDTWALLSGFVVEQAIMKLCKTDINDVRKKMGLILIK